MSYLAVLGMEIHAELATRTGMFCGCVNDPDATEPNRNICPVCLGLPGALPTLNSEAIRMLVSLAADLGATVDPLTKWDRKNYFYPDLPKGYQISQFDQPLLRGGRIEVSAAGLIHAAAVTSGVSGPNNSRGFSGGVSRSHIDWPLTRIHLEEDTGTLIHAPDGTSLVDFNRSGVPLAELVTEPIVVPIDVAPALAKRFSETYQFLLQRRGISRANMEKGELRCEANVSVIQASSKQQAASSEMRVATGDDLSGTKVEVKNLNSFRAVERAVRYEIDRHVAALETGESILMETRGWDEAKQRTVSQRAKETSAEYRYFPEPDLPAINPRVMFGLDDHQSVGEPFPYQLATQLIADYGLSEREAEYFSSNAQAYADLTELIAETSDQPDVLKAAAGMAVNFETARALPVSELTTIGRLLTEGKLPRHRLRPLFDALAAKPGATVESLIAELGLADQADDNSLATTITSVLTEHADAVAKYRSGKAEVLGFLVGQAMRAAGGKLDPAAVRSALMKVLSV